MPAPIEHNDIADAEMRDLLRALAIIRGQPYSDSPDLRYTRLVCEYTHYRVRGVDHAPALRMIARELAAWYPDAPALHVACD